MTQLQGLANVGLMAQLQTLTQQQQALQQQNQSMQFLQAFLGGASTSGIRPPAANPQAAIQSLSGLVPPGMTLSQAISNPQAAIQSLGGITPAGLSLHSANQAAIQALGGIVPASVRMRLPNQPHTNGEIFPPSTSSTSPIPNGHFAVSSRSTSASSTATASSSNRSQSPRYLDGHNSPTDSIDNNYSSMRYV